MLTKRSLSIIALFVSVLGIAVAAKITGTFAVTGGLTTDDFGAPSFLDFDDPGGGGGDFTFTAEISGDFASVFAAGDPGAIVDLGTSPVSGVDPFLAATKGGTFVQVSMTDFTYSGDGDFILGTGTGTLKMTGFEDTPAVISLAAIQLPIAFGFKAGEGPFFATIAAVPEPSTGMFLIGGCLLALRRRR